MHGKELYSVQRKIETGPLNLQIETKLPNRMRLMRSQKLLEWPTTKKNVNKAASKRIRITDVYKVALCMIFLNS